MEKYPEKAKILKIDIKTSNEGDVIFETINQNFECFICLDEIKIFQGLKKNQIINVEFSLLNLSATKLAEHVKKIQQAKKIGVRVNRTMVFGEIIEISDHPNPKFWNYRRVVLDCGVFIKTRIPRDQNFKKGDFIRVEGRLDAHFVN